MEVQELNGLIEKTDNEIWKNLFIKGDTYKNYSTLIVIASRGKKKTTAKCECGKSICIEYET
jgi:hypothetical protein